MATRVQLSDSLEDYMEAIFHIEVRKRAARAKDIADRLQVSNSSVTGALRLLSDKGLINYAPYDIITLTPQGKEVAQGVVRKHKALCKFFVNILRIDQDEAEEAACKLEHGISNHILSRIQQFTKCLEDSPPECRSWLERFETLCEEREPLEKSS